MKNPETYVRHRRWVDVVHGEAFQLMLYRSNDGQHDRWFWNSRDGVTPFITSIDGVEYSHAMNLYQPRYLTVLPEQAEFVWVSYTPESWAEMARKRWQTIKDAPAGEWHDPAKFAEQFPSAEDFAAVMPFERGQPRQITRDEFLAATSEWMGKSE